MRLNIILLPPPRIRAEIGSFVRRLDKEVKLKLAVDNKKFIPHITLFHFVLPTASLKHATSILGKIAKSQKSLSIKSKGPGVGKKFGSFDYDLENSTGLLALHKEVVDKFSSMRIMNKFQDPPDLTSQEKTYFRKYGTPQILKLYRPHITLGIVKDKKMLKPLTTKVKYEPLENFRADRIALTKINSYGQVYEILKTFPLK